MQKNVFAKLHRTLSNFITNTSAGYAGGGGKDLKSAAIAVDALLELSYPSPAPTITPTPPQTPTQTRTSSTAIVHERSLSKCGGGKSISGSKGWKDRFLRLTSDTLLYYNKAGRYPRGACKFPVLRSYLVRGVRLSLTSLMTTLTLGRSFWRRRRGL